MTAISSKSESIGLVNLLYIVRAGSLQVVTTGKKTDQQRKSHVQVETGTRCKSREHVNLLKLQLF